MSDEKGVCPKCGGEMVEGRLTVPFERMSSNTMSQFTPGLDMGGIPRIVEAVSTSPRWEEKTGKKTGLIFKRDETRKMMMAGRRCTLCNYIELYAQEK